VKLLKHKGPNVELSLLFLYVAGHGERDSNQFVDVTRGGALCGPSMGMARPILFLFLLVNYVIYTCNHYF
jgi:hypothetical protein